MVPNFVQTERSPKTVLLCAWPSLCSHHVVAEDAPEKSVLVLVHLYSCPLLKQLKKLAMQSKG